MKLVIGGAYQGKLEYVQNNILSKNASVFECKEDGKIDLSYDIVSHIERWSLWCVKNDIEPSEYFSDNLVNRDITVISDDISSGIVPMDKTERMWREANGRLLMYVSKNSGEVYRVFCGIGTRIK